MKLNKRSGLYTASNVIAIGKRLHEVNVERLNNGSKT